MAYTFTPSPLSILGQNKPLFRREKHVSIIFGATIAIPL